MFWIAGCCGAILALPRRVALVISITLILGNTAGASWWIGAKIPGGFWVGLGMFLAIGTLVVTTWAKAGVIVHGNHRKPGES
jgi:hypothetical protein